MFCFCWDRRHIQINKTTKPAIDADVEDVMRKEEACRLGAEHSYEKLCCGRGPKHCCDRVARWIDLIQSEKGHCNEEERDMQ